jgi:4-diphosphocytidyl-2-C-methyl-D-erythritol kinase
MTDRVARLAPAKVNLALHVTGRRADGYHLLDSIAVFADVGDRVEIEAADTLSLSVTGPFAAHAPGDSSDLAFRAAAAFFEHIGRKAATDPLPLVGRGLGEGLQTWALRGGPQPQPLPTGGRGVPAAAIRVEKNIPAGAGLGGGSADAAAVLVGLDRHFGTRLSPDDLKAIGMKLGADVPMCLAGRALRARGIGEDISAIQGWPPLPLVLVWPGVPVSTAAVFKNLTRSDNPPLVDPPRSATVETLASWLSNCRNDLEAPAINIAPQIGEALAALRATESCLLARMSGSGSACFGLYPKPGEARAAAAAIARARLDWWSAATAAS